MAFQNQTDLDVVYDDKVYGNIIDPTQWNGNFKKIEEIVNGNIDKVDANFDALEAITDGSSGADGIGATPVGAGDANTVQGILHELYMADFNANGLLRVHTENSDNPHTVTKAQVGLGDVDNTADSVKPVSTAQAYAIAKKVTLTGAETIAGVKTFSSSPVVPTPTTGDSSTKVASTAFVAATMVAVGAGDMAKAVYDTGNKATDVFTYIDAKFDLKTATITGTWVGTSAPYTQEISVSGITADDKPIITPVYSATNATAILEQIAWNYIGKIETGADKIICTCFESKPVTAINIQIKGV